MYIYRLQIKWDFTQKKLYDLRRNNATIVTKNKFNHQSMNYHIQETINKRLYCTQNLSFSTFSKTQNIYGVAKKVPGLKQTAAN
jgi:hypothetical protein